MTRTVSRLFVSLGALLASLIGLGSEARSDLVDETWIELDAPHFQILSQLSEKETRELAHDLEMFRQTVLLVTNAKRVAPPVPVRIVALRRASDWRELGIEGAGGLVLPRMRDYFVVLDGQSDDLATATMRRDFAHFILRNQNRVQPPRWYDEGYAEFLGTVEVGRDQVVVGRFPDHRADMKVHSNWIPIKDIIDPQGMETWTDERIAMFYAEAWALVHFLLVGSDERGTFQARFNEYLVGLEAGEDPRSSFEDAFGISLGRLDRLVKRYLQKGRVEAFAIPTKSYDTDFEVTVRTPSKREVALALGQLSLARGDSERARTWLERVAAELPKNAPAEAGLGSVEQSNRQWDAAWSRFRAALEADPDDALVQLDVARFWMSRFRDTQDEKEKAVFLSRARGHFVRAWELDKSIPETYAMYGQSYLVAGDDPARAVEMLGQAAALLPASLEIRLLQAEAHMAAGQEEEAKADARAVVSFAPPDSPLAGRARDMLAKLQAPEPAPAKGQSHAESERGAAPSE